MFKKTLFKAARNAGEILEKDFHKLNGVKAKDAHDLVSDADVKSEKEIISVIKSNFPWHTIIAEESGEQNKKSEYEWIIDPLDGTANFIMGIPYFSVSIAVTYRGEVIAGIVLNPVLKEIYYAEKGCGACLNGSSIKVSKKSKIEDALMGCAYSSTEKEIVKGLKIVEKLSLKARKVVVNFSPALTLCNIARGRMDASVDPGTTPEDHAAGSLILQEAGGKIQNFSSEKWNAKKKGMVASNGYLQSSILKILVNK